ncbi:zinc finger CCHC-type and RNA-binding motif-containing protein 1-like [Mya arenaria]|uniref:zinc finger CCHC-type and RNA-binding motif-containing protein 1-like n=1 Tax=Mya arenaria TaxID=6604 RepID=UPI0022E95081|nr:zinc finger CCHC-type and RNA-binding motif-containing protein 1-like [Mya arenaria]XP_052782284.1 zinc finger CCHC-type and RNA-binding motif-containing protein 1-like [Mya arenaria]XP_052782285.1 zinc finger CCHC-type and RNA-binding motif-containing protein 1-like [Mya arenaria]XP_052782286.1 zinc finger CCHC-type and RNA-binding motif-containing protein 1-like [Mya arenaria]
MSGGIAPSKSTVYISNFAFSLTNNDLHKIFEKYGKVVKVTIVKDQVTRKSKGVAFVLFLERDSAYQAVRALNNTQLFGRTIKCIIAKDNGRATEFIRKKTYPDKSRCYECGDEGHMSYKCPRNILGEREPPPKKTKKDKKREREERGENFVDLSGESGSEEEGEDPKQDSLAAAIQFQQQKLSEEQVGQGSSRVLVSAEDFMEQPHRKRFKKDAYFSDEEEVDDGATGDT